jgi:hypothetical protein
MACAILPERILTCLGFVFPLIVPVIHGLKRVHKPSKNNVLPFFLLTMPEFVEEKAEQFDSEQQNNVEESTTEPGRVLYGFIFGLIAFLLLSIGGYFIYTFIKSH